MKTSIEDYSILKKGASINYSSARLNHNARKVINYIYEKQYNIRDYEDYLRWCSELGMNLSDKNILYPVEPAKAHDQMMREVETKKNVAINKGIADFAKTLEQLSYKDRKFIIFPVHDQNELINESKVCLLYTSPSPRDRG